MIRVHNEENKKYVNNEVIVPLEGQTLKDIENELLNKIKTKTEITL